MSRYIAAVKNLPIELFGEYTIRFLAQGNFAETAIDVGIRLKKPSKRKLEKAGLEAVKLIPVP